MKVLQPSLLVTLMALLPLPAAADEAIDKHWDIDANAMVSVENTAGSIKIQGWDRNEVHLTGKLGSNVRELEAKQSQSGLELTVVNRHERNVGDSSLVLQVPASAILEATGVSADIGIAAMKNAKLTARTVSGDVDVEASSDWVTLKSISGDVTFSGNSKRVSADTVSGDIDLSGISGELAVTTVSGDMELTAGELGSCKLETVSGDIGLEASLTDTGRLSAESMSGDVSVRLPAGQMGQFKARSFSGRIRTDFGKVEHAQHGPGSHLRYSAGSNSAELRVESFSGNITIRGD
ncbi:MAG: DUF4097 family beta strand repeat-containing protein [Lysobacterales bacterium]|jgi:DUF4097 and DUF4098 domain-containing protein YvlB